MEPVDPRMRAMLGEGDPSAGPEDLHSIVARAGRRMRLRAAAVAGAVAVVAGGGVGYAVSTTGGPGRQIVATSPSSGSGARASSEAPGGAVPAGEPSVALPQAAHFTRLFTRQANGIDIRAYLIASPMLLPGGTSACGSVGTLFQAETSTPDMVSVAPSTFEVQPATSPIISDNATVVGVAEGDPVAVVDVQTTSAVAKVRMAFTGGARDEMKPVKGWSALAAPVPWYQAVKAGQVTVGMLTALDSAGKSLSSVTVVWPTPVTGVYGSGSSSASSSGSGSATAPSIVPPASDKTAAAAAAAAAAAREAAAQEAEAAAAARAAALACPVPPSPPTSVPCTPPTTVKGAIYACASPAVTPVGPPTTGAPTKGSGGQ